MNRRIALWALAVIFAANFLSYLDRQIVGALETELKAAFRLSKTGYGWVVSMFTIGYMIFAPVVGFLANRVRRTRVLAACVFVWSLATVASGWAQDAWVLYVARLFIGVGEAGCLVLGPTLLADYFSKEARGRALSVFFLGLPLGGTAGYLVGGIGSQLLGGWRNAFYAAGLPGIFVAALIWFLAEPVRGASDPQESEEKVSGVRPYLDLLRNKGLLWIVLAQAFAVMVLVPLLYYAIEFFQLERHMSKERATVTLGAMALVAGGLGNTLSGIVGDRWARRTPGAYAYLAALGFMLGVPFLIVGFSVENAWIFVPALGAGAFCYFLCMPAVNTHIANVVPAQKRAMAYAVAVFILHLLGDTGAPPAFGAIASAIGTESAFIGFTFSLVLSSVCCVLAGRWAGRPAQAEAPRPEKVASL